MKYLWLVWSGVWRHPGRALLLVVQIGFAFALFGLLHGMTTALKRAADEQRADVLYVTSRISGDFLPLHYQRRIETVPGVALVNPQNFLPGYYQHPTQPVIAVATDLTRYFTINTYLRGAPDLISAAQKSRTGAMVGAELARKHGWKVGDRVPVISNILQKDGSQSWTFDIAGIYEYPDEPDMSTLLILNNEYFDQTRVDLPEGFVARFVVKIATPQQAPDVIDSIDALFANSAAETITASENASAQERLQSMGDLDLLARAVTGAAFSALLLSVGTMLVYSVRQRTPELGVLKAIGFSNRRIVIVIGAEIMLVALTGAVCGLIAAWCVLPLAREYVGLVQMPGVVVILALGCAVLLALICSWLPVRHALRLRIVEALARP